MKTKKIVSLVLAVSMVLSMFCGLNITSSAAEETTYSWYAARSYGFANRYGNPTDWSVGNYNAGTGGAESYDELADGVDSNRTPYVAYTIEAPEAGEYSVQSHVELGNVTSAEDRYFAFAVKDSNGDYAVYKSGVNSDSTEYSEKYFPANIQLTKGINTVYAISFTNVGGAWHNQINLLADSRLKVYSSTVKAAEAETVGKYNRNTDGTLGGGWGGGTSQTAGITVQNLANITRAAVVANSSYYTIRYYAPKAGSYEALIKYTGGNFASLNAMAIFVGDNNQSQAVPHAFNSVAKVSLNLQAGVNDILITALLPDNGTSTNIWSNQYSISILGADATRSTSELKLEAEKSEMINLYTVNEWTLGGADNTYAPVISFNEGITPAQLAKMPYYSYTINAPESGRYLIKPKIQRWETGSYYLGLVVDGNTLYTEQFSSVADNDLSKVYVPFSVYLTAGIHTVTVTSAFTGDNRKSDWLDQLDITFYGGITRAAVQLSPIDGLARLEAETYGIQNYYGQIEPITDKQTSGNKAYGGFYGTQQDYDTLAAFYNPSNTGSMSFVVDAPADGNYTVKPGYAIYDGSGTDGLYMAVLVNDEASYKVPFVKAERTNVNWNDGSTQVALKQGRNVIRIIPYVTANGGWHRMDYLALDSRLTGVAPAATDLKAVDSEYISRYTVSGNSLVNTQTDYMKSSQVAIENLSTANLCDVSYFAYTLNAPKSGYYNLMLRFNTDSNSPEGQIGVLVNGVAYSKKIAASTKGTGYAYNRANVSVYLNEGANNIVFTARLPETAADVDGYKWTDLETLTITGGLTKAEVQNNPAAVRNFADAEESYAYRRNFTKAENWRIVASDANGGYVVGNSEISEGAESFEKLNKGLDQNGIAYIAYAVNAPAAGDYEVYLRYRLGYTDDDETLWDKYIEEYGQPYAAVVVNGVAQKAYYPEGAVKGSMRNSAPVTLTLNEGLNIIYTMAITGDIVAALPGAYIDHDCIVLPEGLSIVNNLDMYIPGDANLDGELTVVDIVRLKKISANISPETYAADFDDNGVNADDIVILRKLLLGVYDQGFGTYSWLRTRENVDAASDITTSTAAVLDSDDVSAFVTVAGTEKKFQNDSQNLLTSEFGVADAVINIDTNSYLSTVEGFGASITESSAVNLMKMNASSRNKVMNELFSSENGIGLNMLRQPIGSSDFAIDYYTYADTKGPDNDLLANFSIQHDVDNKIIPLLQQAKSIIGNDFKLLGAVWSPPKWMKTHDSWGTVDENGETLNNTLKTEYYETFAQYLSKTIDAYSQKGLAFDAISTANEPGAAVKYPSTRYNQEQQIALLNVVSPVVREKGVKVLGWDQGWDIKIPLDFLPKIGDLVDGLGFHYYTGEVNNMAEYKTILEDNNMDLGFYMTENAGHQSDDKTELFRQIKNMSASFKNYANSWITWNICLDQHYGPIKDNLNAVRGTGLVKYDYVSGKASYQMDFYALAHYSKFINSGDEIVSSTDLSAEGIYNTVAMNGDGTLIAVIGNENDVAKTVTLNVDGQGAVQYTIPANAVVTIANV